MSTSWEIPRLRFFWYTLYFILTKATINLIPKHLIPFKSHQTFINFISCSQHSRPSVLNTDIKKFKAPVSYMVSLETATKMCTISKYLQLIFLNLMLHWLCFIHKIFKYFTCINLSVAAWKTHMYKLLQYTLKLLLYFTILHYIKIKVNVEINLYTVKALNFL
jgi:hypothetical protein